MTSFQHFYGYEPHWKNHIVPHYGVFSRFYFDRYVKNITGIATKFSGFKQNFGPPHFGYEQRHNSLEDNAYLQRAGVSPEATKFNGTVPKVTA